MPALRDLTNIKIVFRVDASLRIGTGHVMRCLTLADVLSAKGGHCQFICRKHEGHLIDFIRSKNYTVHALAAEDVGPQVKTKNQNPADNLMHSHWLGASQAEDAAACTPILTAQPPDWLVVDHYALDEQWENALAPHCHRLMVIDDLADRHHACHLLLDQTFGRSATDYRSLVPQQCQLLCGSAYALLRPEFASLRPYSLQRRAQQPALRQLLITMGGVDKGNATGQVLQALRHCPLPPECAITVVMGSTAPHLETIRLQAQNMPWLTRVLVGVENMAQIMADSDLAIGAAGATAWERCCLGLPSLMVVLAENQQKISAGLKQAGATALFTLPPSFETQLQEAIDGLVNDAIRLQRMSQSAAQITQGQGTTLVLQELGKQN